MASREFEVRPPRGGIVSFQTGGAPAAPRIGATNFEGIQRSLQAFTEQAEQRRVAEGTRVAEERAIREQSELGTAQLAEPEREWGEAYQNAFQEKARAIYEQKLKTDVFRTTNELRRQHMMDPDGFSNSLQAYRESTVQTVEQTDPTFAQSVGTYIDQVGFEVAEQINTDVFKNDLESQSLEAENAILEELSAGEDYLLNSPNEQNLQEATASAYESIAQLDEVTAVSPRQQEKLRRSVNERYAYAYSRGRANQAIADEDYAGAQVVIDELRAGKLFDDNRQGEALANSIERDLNAATNERNSALDAGLQRYRDQTDAVSESVSAGNEYTDDQQALIDRAITFADSYDPAAAEELRRTRRSLQFQNEFRSEVNMATPGELSLVEQTITSPEGILSLDEETRRSVQNMIDQRRDYFADAQAKQDWTKFGDPEVAEVAPGEIMNTPDGQFDIFMGMMDNSRRRAAANSGQPVQAVPYWTQEQREGWVDVMRNAPDSDTARRAFTRYIAPYQRSGNMIAGARNLAQMDAEIGGAMLMSAHLMDPSARDSATFINMATQGLATEGVERFSTADLSSGAQASLRAIAGGDGTLYGAALRGLQAVAIGAEATMGVDAVEYAEEQLRGVEITGLSNGFEVPTRLLGDGPREQELSRATLNQFFADVPENYAADRLRPEPIDNRRFRFVDVQTNTVFRDADGKAIEASIEEEEFVEAKDRDAETIQRQREQNDERMMNALQLADSDRNFFQTIGGRAGLSEDQSKALFTAISLSPAKSIERLPDGIVPEAQPRSRPVDSEETEFARSRPGAGAPRTAVEPSEYALRGLRLIDQEQAEVRSPQEMREGTGLGFINRQSELRAGTITFYADMLEKFDNDTKKALAAVAAGEAEVNDAIEIGGDEWLDSMGDDIKAFVRRGLPNG